MKKKIKNKKPKSKNIHFFLHGKNLDKIKLLVSWDKFQVDLLQLRKDFSIPSEGFSSNEEIKKWDKKLSQDSDAFWETEDYKNRRKKLLLLRKKDYRQFLIEQELINEDVPINKFNRAIRNLVNKYHLPYNFLDAIKMYVYHNKIASVFLPSTNFSLSFDPEGRKGKTRWIEIKTYALVTEKEIRSAVKSLRNLQKLYFSPNLTQNVRVHKNIDVAIAIEKEKKNIDRKREKEKASSYLEKVRKQYGEKMYRKTIRERQTEGIKLIKRINKNTSREIAKKIFGTPEKENLVRQIYSRLQKERKRLFET